MARRDTQCKLKIARPKIQIVRFDHIIRFIFFYSELPMKFFE